MKTGNARLMRRINPIYTRVVVFMHLWMGILGILLLLAYYDDAVALPQILVFRGVSLIALLELVVISVVVRNGIWSIGGMYSTVFWLFHFGLTSVLALGLRDHDSLIGTLNRWVFQSSATEAAVLACMGFTACGIGIQITRFMPLSLRRSLAVKTDGQLHSALESSVASVVGCILVVASIASWFALVIQSGGPRILLGSYQQYLFQTSTVSSYLANIYFLLGVGVLAVSNGNIRKCRLIALLSFVVFAVVALPLGLRGEVMYPVLASCLIYYREHRPPSFGVSILLILSLMSVIALIKSVRAVGVTDIASANINTSALDGFSELGGSLQPTHSVIQWIRSGDRFRFGATLWAPFDRGIGRLVPFWGRRDAYEDDRLMNVVVAKREGNIGFSPVAESYINFGIIGVPICMLILGATVGALESTRSTRFNNMVIGVFLIPLFINIRNSFSFVPGQIIEGVLIVVSIRACALIIARLGAPHQSRIVRSQASSHP